MCAGTHVYMCTHRCVSKLSSSSRTEVVGMGRGIQAYLPVLTLWILQFGRKSFHFLNGFRITFCSAAGKSVQRKMNYEHLGMSP